MTKRVPGRRWYVVAGAVATVGVVVALVVLATGFRSWLDGFPDLGSRFRDGESVRVDLTAGQPMVLYVSPDSATTDYLCTGEVAGVPIVVTEVTYTFTFFVRGFETWAARYEVESARTGSGQLTCSPVRGRGAELLAIGEQPDNGRLLRIMATTFGLAGVAAVAGIGAGGVITLVTWRRRKAHRGGVGVRSEGGLPPNSY
ncbi:hypothetical protein ACTMTJ_42580 [Phytohabitans sp. LJ34]|uniref:hypothetical protein n=1 Tax=Phytohabitans sp. LJ34 TaxID=3452217 RepID=UPI003F8BCEFD